MLTDSIATSQKLELEFLGIVVLFSVLDAIRKDLYCIYAFIYAFGINQTIALFSRFKSLSFVLNLGTYLGTYSFTKNKTGWK